MRAAVYTRVSTAEQADGYSLPQQLEACLKHIEANGWEFVGEYVDAGDSAYKNGMRRPQLLALREQLDTFDVVVVYELDRFARNRRDYFNLKHEFEQAGTKLVSLKEQLGESASDIIIESVWIGQAEAESKKTEERVRRNMRVVAASGRLPTKAPVGYLNYGEASMTGRGPATIVVDEKTGPLVQEAFERYARGDVSLRELCAQLNRKGLRNTRGNPVQAQSLMRTLRNPFYKGWIKWGDVFEKGTHPALVTEELWTRVQLTLDARNQRGTSGWVNDHYLKGLLHCSCGRRMAYQVSKGHGYYYCLRKQCSEPYARADALEEEVAGLYVDIALPDAMRSKVERWLDEAFIQQEGRRTATLKRLTNQLSSLTSQREKLLKLYYADALDVDTFREERERIDAETRSAEREIKGANASLDEARDVLRLAMDALKAMEDVYRRASEATRRKFNLACFEYVTVSKQHVTEARLAEPFRSVQSVPTRDITWRYPNANQTADLRSLLALAQGI